MTKLHYPRLRSSQKRYLGFVDGLEGGFAIFAGIVTGLSFATNDRNILIASAMIGIMVNAVNTATIRYSYEHYMDELDGREKRSPWKNYLFPSVIEFCLYGLVSLLSLLPLLFITSLPLALFVMISICLFILFSAGAYRGATFGTHPLRDGIELLIGGAIMIIVGASAGWLISHIIV